MPVEYEEIQVSRSQCNKDVHYIRSDSYESIEARNIDNVVASSEALRDQTYKALQEGYYPIVLGGDHS